MSSILVVEDDEVLGRGVTAALTGAGFEVRWRTTGAATIAAMTADRAELVLLDLGLPDCDGLEVCRVVRQRWPASIVVVLTARSAELDAVVALDSGADDYVTKPFRLMELVARLRAHLRRAVPDDREPIALGGLVLDRRARVLLRDDREVPLRPKEYDLLLVLATHAGELVTREELMERVWDEHWFGSTKTLDVHVSTLRARLADEGEPDLIRTVRGVGYRLDLADRSG